MNRLPSRLLTAALWLLPAAALAQDDDKPIPYPEQTSPAPDDTATGAAPAPETHEDAATELKEREKSLSRMDDPNVGLEATVFGGVMLLDSSRGQLVEPRFMWGARATWEYGRLFDDEALHEGLFLDASWAWATLNDGTQEIFVSTNYHYFSLAPAYEVVLPSAPEYGFYAQLGGGIAYQVSNARHDGTDTPISGVKPIFQYGVGFRGRPYLSFGEHYHFAFRLELTRFRRQYMDDTMIAGSVGASF